MHDRLPKQSPVYVSNSHIVSDSISTAQNRQVHSRINLQNHSPTRPSIPDLGIQWLVFIIIVTISYNIIIIMIHMKLHESTWNYMKSINHVEDVFWWNGYKHDTTVAQKSVSQHPCIQLHSEHLHFAFHPALQPSIGLLDLPFPNTSDCPRPSIPHPCPIYQKKSRNYPIHNVVTIHVPHIEGQHPHQVYLERPL